MVSSLNSNTDQSHVDLPYYSRRDYVTQANLDMFYARIQITKNEQVIMRYRFALPSTVITVSKQTTMLL